MHRLLVDFAWRSSQKQLCSIQPKLVASEPGLWAVPDRTGFARVRHRLQACSWSGAADNRMEPRRRVAPIGSWGWNPLFGKERVKTRNGVSPLQVTFVRHSVATRCASQRAW